MIALLMAAALQQDAAALARQLGADDVDARDAAQKALIAMGPPALEHVRPLLTSDDPEVAVRASIVVKSIETNERRRVVRGEVTRVTVKAKTFKEALAAIDPKLAEGVEDKALDFAVEGAPLWEALDKLAQAHGGVDFVSAAAEPKEIYGLKLPSRAIAMETRAPGKKPTAYVGPYRVRVEKATNSRHWIAWGQLDDPGPRLTIRLDAQPNVFPESMEGTIAQATAEGKWAVAFAAGVESHVFEGWRDEKRDLGPFTVSFRPENCDGANCTMSFAVDWKDAEMKLLGNDLRRHFAAAALSKDGKTRVEATAEEMSSGARGVYYIVPHKGAGHGRIELRAVTEWFTDEVPFDFGSVAIPKF